MKNRFGIRLVLFILIIGILISSWKYFNKKDSYYAYVANTGDGTVSVIDTNIDEVIETIKIDNEISDGIATNPMNNEVYTANIDLESKKVIETIITGEVPNHVFKVPNSKKMYVSNLDSGDVAVVNIDTYEVTKKIKVGKKPHEIGFLKNKIKL